MSSRPASVRRTDTLFDNRYRIEQTYPRGSSGETLRAVDTQNNERPVLIKRPALQDAAPMRTGQEQNILYEKRILERLAGHSAIPEVIQTGIFRVGGQAHQYLVMQAFKGPSLDEFVHAESSQKRRVPDLELLVIFSALLDTVAYAHERKVVHNSLSPSAIVWDRERYQLGVTGWDKAILLDAESVPAGVTRANDLAQLGQLLAFAAYGDSPESNLAPTLSDSLSTIVLRANAEDQNQRYSTLAALKTAIDSARQQAESERNAALDSLRQQIQSANSTDELDNLHDKLNTILAIDPGYPPANALLGELDQRRSQRAAEENLHAVNVYITSGNMVRAAAVLNELKSSMGSADSSILDYLLEAVQVMQSDPIRPLPAGLPEALSALLTGDIITAGRGLVTTPETRPTARQQRNLLTERLTAYVPELVLLRPHLSLLENALISSNADAWATLQSAVGALDKDISGLQPLRTAYYNVLTGLAVLRDHADLSEDTQHYVNQAGAAAEHIVNHLDNALRTIYAEPDAALVEIDQAASIDPQSNSFEATKVGLHNFVAELSNLRSATVSGTAQDVISFLQQAQTRLKAYQSNIPDTALNQMLQGITSAISAWTQAGEAIALGGRRPAIAAYQQASESVKSFNQSAAQWFADYAQRLEQTPQIEQFSANASLGAALQQGWELWDRGRATEARAAGEQALPLATTEGETLAAQRLIQLSEVLNAWLLNDGPLNPKRTEQIEAQVNKLFLPHEDTIRRTFTKQMPDAQIYLKAMSRGIVEPMREASAAAVRTLFFHYVLRGMMALQQDAPDEANFYREAALKSVPAARTHPGYQALDMAITRRQLTLDAVAALNKVTHVSMLPAARQAVRAPLAASQLEALSQAMAAIDEALARWSEGNFRAARHALDTAMERTTFAETTFGKNLTPFKNWLQDLTASAEVLQQARYSIEQIALVPENEPNPTIIDAHHKIIEITRRDLGEAYTVNVRQWRDTYNGIRDLYLDSALNRHEKTRLLDGYLESPTLETQPALPIIRHWCDLVQHEPKPEVYTPPSPAVAALYTTTVDPEDLPVPEATPTSIERSSSSSAGSPSGTKRKQQDAPVSTLPLVIGGIIVAVIFIGLGVLFFSSQTPPPTFVVVATNPPEASPVLAANPTSSESSTPSPTFTPAATSTPPTLPPTITRVVPTPTKPVTAEPDTPLPPGTGTALPVGVKPGGTVVADSTLQPPTFVPTASGGDYDLLAGLGTLPTTKVSWNQEWFGPAGNGWQLGTATLKAGSSPLVVRLGPDIMTALYGVDAARKLTQVDASLELVSYDKSLLPTGLVYFGVGLESLTGPRAAAQGRLVQTNVLDLGINQNGQFIRKTQIPVTQVKFAITIKRNDDNTITLLVDGQSLGTSAPSFTAGNPVNIYLFTSSSGIVVNITSLKVKLS